MPVEKRLEAPLRSAIKFLEDWLVQFAEALEKPVLLSEYRRLLEKIQKCSQ